MRKEINSKRKFKYTKIGAMNVERYAEDREKQNLVDLAMDKKPLEFASEFHSRMLERIKDLLDPYREELAHDLMKNKTEEIEEDFDFDNLTEEEAEYLLGCIEEDEQLDELNKNTLKSYIKKANTGPKSGKRRAGVNDAISGVLGKDKFKSIFGKYAKEETDLEEKHSEFGDEYAKMYAERKKTFKKMAKGMPKPFDKKHPMKEDEELNELTKKLLGKYMKKAAPQAAKLAVDITKGGKRDSKTLNKFKNRVTGVHYAKSVIDDPDED